jgi:patatin-like phospholipase/acyl hydrolase
MPAEELVKVLSIDGGGIRGIIPALVLAEIERRTERPACELFDLIAGTSTGGIIALGVTAPADAEHDGGAGAGVHPRWSAAQLAEMYAREGPHVFHRSLVRTIVTADGLLVQKYAATGLEKLLETRVGGVTLSQALTDVLITAYDIHAHEPLFFKSFQPRARPAPGSRAGAPPSASAASRAASQTLQTPPPPPPPAPPPPTPTPLLDYPMTVVGRATSAAPTYFKPEDVSPSAPATRGGAGTGTGTRTGAGASDSSDYVLVDGGTFANNPAMCAYAEAVRNHPGADVLIVSLGTGRLTESISYRQAKHWGLIQWAQPLLGVIMDGASAAIDYQLDELLGSDRGHFRFQTLLEGASDSLDDVSASNIAGLRTCAERLIERDTPRLDAVCARLLGIE